MTTPRTMIGIVWLFMGVLFTGALVIAGTEAPKISAEQRAKFWKAQAEYVSATARAQKAESVLVAIQTDLSKTCGESHQLALDNEGEPMCQPKPAPPQSAIPGKIESVPVKK